MSKVCSVCKVSKGKDDYSKVSIRVQLNLFKILFIFIQAQFKKAEGERKCKACVDGTLNTFCACTISHKNGVFVILTLIRIGAGGAEKVRPV